MATYCFGIRFTLLEENFMFHVDRDNFDHTVDVNGDFFVTRGQKRLVSKIPAFAWTWPHTGVVACQSLSGLVYI